MAAFVALMDYAIRSEVGPAGEPPSLLLGWFAGWLAWCLPKVTPSRWLPVLGGGGLLLMIGRYAWVNVVGLTMLISTLLRSELTPALRMWWLAAWKVTWLAVWLLNSLAQPIMGAPAGVAVGGALSFLALYVIMGLDVFDPGGES